MSLKAKAFSAVRWTALGVVVKVLLQFMQVVILARLLAPEEIGAMAIAVSITAFVIAFVDIGISNAIISQQRISPAERTSLYWLNVLVGGGIAILFAGASPWVAAFYDEPVLQDVLLILSPYFLVFAAGQQLKVMAEKELMFGQLLGVELTAAVWGFAVTVGCAWAGLGVKSVALGLLLGAVVFTVLAWRYLSMGWRPKLDFDLTEIRGYIRYGAYVLGNNFLSGINGAADVFLGGRIAGLGALAGYSLSRDLMLNIGSVINAVVTRVGLPLMAKAQDSPERLKFVYLKTLRMTASINMPIFMSGVVLAPEIIHVVFGERWAQATPLLQWLAIWGMLRAIGQPVGSLIFAVGRAELAFKWNLVWVFIMLPSWWLGLQFGLDGLVKTMVAVSVLAQLPNWWYLVRPLCGAGLVDYFSQLVPPLLVSLLTAGVVMSLLGAVEVLNAYLRLALGLCAGAVVYVIASYLLNREWLYYLGQALTSGREST